MILKPNRMLLSNTDIYKIINSQSGTKLDLSFVDKSNHISPDQLRGDLDLIKTRNFPLMRQVVEAVESGKIIVCRTNNVSSSMVYVFGSKNNRTLDTVFVNITRFSKVSRDVNMQGDIVETPSIVGGYEVLYDVLLGAYVGLNAQKLYMSSGATNKIREVYTDMFAQITSRNIANPIDGVKFRFLVDHFFYNGEVTGMEVAQLTKYQLDKASALTAKYPDWFCKRDGLSLIDFIDLLAEEFPSLARRGLSPETFVIGAVTSLGDNAVYMMDNFAYLAAVITVKARKCKIFPGYMLRNIETDASLLLSQIYQSII